MLAAVDGTSILSIVAATGGTTAAAALIKLAITVNRVEQKVDDLPCRCGRNIVCRYRKAPAWPHPSNRGKRDNSLSAFQEP